MPGFPLLHPQASRAAVILFSNTALFRLSLPPLAAGKTELNLVLHYTKQTACGISGSVMTSNWPFFYCRSWNCLLSSQQQWRRGKRPVKMVSSRLALSLHVVPRIVGVLQPCDTKRLNEELPGSELWLHCALPLLCCLSSKLSYRFLSTVTCCVLKDSFPTFLTSLSTSSPGSDVLGFSTVVASSPCLERA